MQRARSCSWLTPCVCLHCVCVRVCIMLMLQFFQRQSSSYVSLLKGEGEGEFVVTYEMINLTAAGAYQGDTVFSMQVSAVHV